MEKEHLIKIGISLMCLLSNRLMAMGSDLMPTGDIDGEYKLLLETNRLLINHLEHLQHRTTEIIQRRDEIQQDIKIKIDCARKENLAHNSREMYCLASAAFGIISLTAIKLVPFLYSTFYDCYGCGLPPS